MTERKSWTKEEDDFIATKYRQNQTLEQRDRLKWGDIADQLNSKFQGIKRTGKQCRQRWHNQLDPSISKEQWTQQQEDKLFQLQMELGNKWAVIANKLQGRTDNNVKNYFYSTLRKSLRKINTYISANKSELHYCKEFPQPSLNKLLAVADHKFDKKVKLSKGSFEDLAVNIKNKLIEIAHLEPLNQQDSDYFRKVVEQLQQFNKNCKKKKGKRKDQVKMEEIEMESQEVDGQLSGKAQEQNLTNKKMGVQGGGRSKQQDVKMMKQGAKPTKSQLRQSLSRSTEKKKKEDSQIKIPARLQTRQSKRADENPHELHSKINTQQHVSPFKDLQGRISLDLSHLNVQKRNPDNKISTSNLFKSFSRQFPRESQGKIVQKKQSFNISQNSEGFLSSIKQVGPDCLQKRTSKMSNVSDFKIEDNIEEAPLRFFTKKSSFRDFRDFPGQRQSENLSGMLDSSTNFQPNPNMRKLRSFGKNQSLFENEYDMGNGNL